MNELLFAAHLLVTLLFAWGALKLGREAITAWIALQTILANLFVLKQIDLWSFTVTCGDVYAVGTILGLNLLQEYFGKESAVRATWISFFLMIFFALMSAAQVLYLPSAEDKMHAAFVSVLTQTPRLLFASFFTFFVVQRLDVWLFSMLQRFFPKARLLFRASASLILSQFLDTALFSFLGLYGLVSSMMAVFIWSFFIKLLIILAMMPALTLFRRMRGAV